jgi:hypothetical protein
MISEYTFLGDMASETTWEADPSINGWFGVAGDTSGTYATNYMNFMDNAGLMDVPGVGFKFPFLSNPEVTFGLTISAIEAENSFSGWFSSVTGSQFYGMNVDGFMASTVNDPRFVSWGLTSNYAYFDTTVDATYIPEEHYEFVMGELMRSSIGFYYDSTLLKYVTACN